MKYRLIIDTTKEEEVVVTAHQPSLLTQQIEKVVAESGEIQSIMGSREDELKKLDLEKIACITIMDRKTVAVACDGKHYRIQGTLKDFEERLPSYFIRINKSTLANEHRIVRFDTVFSGGVDAVFAGGYREYVSRRCFRQIKRRYEGI